MSGHELIRALQLLPDSILKLEVESSCECDGRQGGGDIVHVQIYHRERHGHGPDVILLTDE